MLLFSCYKNKDQMLIQLKVINYFIFQDFLFNYGIIISHKSSTSAPLLFSSLSKINS